MILDQQSGVHAAQVEYLGMGWGLSWVTGEGEDGYDAEPRQGGVALPRNMGGVALPRTMGGIAPRN